MTALPVARVAADPEHPEGGVGIVEIATPQVPALDRCDIKLRRVSDGKYLRQGGWDNADAVIRLPPANVKVGGGRLRLRLGPDIVEHLENGLGYRIEVVPIEVAANMRWSGVKPRPRTDGRARTVHGAAQAGPDLERRVQRPDEPVDLPPVHEAATVAPAPVAEPPPPPPPPPPVEVLPEPPRVPPPPVEPEAPQTRAPPRRPAEPAPRRSPLAAIFASTLLVALVASAAWAWTQGMWPFAPGGNAEHGGVRSALEHWKETQRIIEKGTAGKQ